MKGFRVLSDTLSGNNKIAFLVCISPSIESSNETLSTLQVDLKLWDLFMKLVCK